MSNQVSGLLNPELSLNTAVRVVAIRVCELGVGMEEFDSRRVTVAHVRDAAHVPDEWLVEGVGVVEHGVKVADAGGVPARQVCVEVPQILEQRAQPWW